MLPARKIHFEAKKKEKENLRFSNFYNCTKNYLKTSIAADAVTVVKSIVRNLRQMK